MDRMKKALSFQFDMQLSFCIVGLARGSFCAVTVFFSRQNNNNNNNDNNNNNNCQERRNVQYSTTGKFSLKFEKVQPISRFLSGLLLCFLEFVPFLEGVF